MCFENDDDKNAYAKQYDVFYFEYIEKTEKKNLPFIFFDFSSNYFSVKNSL